MPRRLRSRLCTFRVLNNNHPLLRHGDRVFVVLFHTQIVHVMDSLSGKEMCHHALCRARELRRGGTTYVVNNGVPHAIDAQIMAFRVWRATVADKAIDRSARGEPFKEELCDWRVKQLACPRQTDVVSCGLHAFLNAMHVICGVELPATYSDKELQAVRGHLCNVLLWSVSKALPSG